MELLNNKADSVNTETTFVPEFADKKTEERSSLSLKNVESLLGTIASNQVLIFAELKRKNKYEAWKTFLLA